MAQELTINGLIDIPQKHAVLMLEAGYLLLEFNKHKEAEEVFTGVAALLPHSEVPHMALGNLYFSQGHLNPALRAHQKALEINPKSAACHAAAGEVLLFLKKPDEAMKHIQEAIALEPNAPPAQFAQALQEAHQLGIFNAV